MFLRREAIEEESPGESPVNTKLLVGRNVKLNAWGLPGSYREKPGSAQFVIRPHAERAWRTIFHPGRPCLLDPDRVFSPGQSHSSTSNSRFVA